MKDAVREFKAWLEKNRADFNVNLAKAELYHFFIWTKSLDKISTEELEEKIYFLKDNLESAIALSGEYIMIEHQRFYIKYAEKVFQKRPYDSNRKPIEERIKEKFKDLPEINTEDFLF